MISPINFQLSRGESALFEK